MGLSPSSASSQLVILGKLLITLSLTSPVCTTLTMSTEKKKKRKKKGHDPRVENLVLFGRTAEDSHLGGGLSGPSEQLFQRGVGAARIDVSFATKTR